MPGEWNALWRRKGRTALTVGGMGCGVLALVLMASLSEHFNLLSSHFRRTYGGRVYVCEKLSFWAGGGILDEDRADEVARQPGVEHVIPLLVAPLDSRGVVVVGLPFVLLGVPARRAKRLWRDPVLAQGRNLVASDEGSRHAVIGSDIAYALRVGAGGRIRAAGGWWTVVGVVARTDSMEDRQMLVSLRSAQRALEREGLLTCLVVTPRPPLRADALADSLKHTVKRLEVIAPSRLRADIDSSLALWQALILACGLLGAVTGALCIIITMAVAVTERSTEIGLKKAIGASAAQIAFDFLGEALLLGLLGWGLGFAGAMVTVKFWNIEFRREGLSLFTVTSRVVWGSATSAVVLAVAAGTVPALYAARLDPIVAMRRRF